MISIKLLFAILVATYVANSRASNVPCTTDEECETILLKGSECVEGRCSNPFQKGGCLAQRLEGWNQIRVCNSEDEPDAMEKGHCRAPNPDFDYMEMRLLTQNWESAFFAVWIMQILLNEILGVPVTLETGAEDKKLDFYHPNSRMDYGTSYDISSLRTAAGVGDCRLVDHSEGYKPCAHVIPELWYVERVLIDELLADKVIERDQLTGTVSHEGLFVPRFTAEEKPSFLTYHGLAGTAGDPTAARRELAETFLRPTRWGDYCSEVSQNNCSIDDGVAQRSPKTEKEASQFHTGEYQGHFRATAENDCETYPDTCSGHFVDYPCGWNSFAKLQLHNLGIALQSGGQESDSNGYTYSEMQEIYIAANATKSHVMMMWWWPEALYQTYLGTDAEMQRVSFPPPTLECLNARVDYVQSCDGESEAVRVGNALDSCDQPPYSLRRVVSQKLVDIINDPSTPIEIRNPGKDALDRIRLDGLQLGQMFEIWQRRGTDKWNFDARDATCQWVVDNFDTIRGWVPLGFPRVTKENEEYFQEPLFYISIVFAVLAFIATISSATGVYLKRKTRAMVYAQVEFLAILLVGMFCVTMGSILLVAPASNWTCISVAWLTNLGYTLELIPLIVKVLAINNLLSAARNLRRKVLSRNRLFVQVFGIAFVVAIFVAVWTIMDPPLKNSQYDMTDEVTDSRETVVRVSYFCESESSYWRFVGAGWHTLMLIAATAMAFQTRKLRSDFNESMVLAILIYSHLSFVLMRLLLFAFEDSLSVWNIPRYLSMIYSADTIITSFIYFYPKIFASTNQSFRRISGLSSNSTRMSIGQGAVTSRTQQEGNSVSFTSSECQNDNSDENPTFEAATKAKAPYMATIDEAEAESKELDIDGSNPALYTPRVSFQSQPQSPSTIEEEQARNSSGRNPVVDTHNTDIVKTGENEQENIASSNDVVSDCDDDPWEQLHNDDENSQPFGRMVEQQEMAPSSSKYPLG